MTAIAIILVITALCLAFANGANDNFKGVATLSGSGTTNFRTALIWATVTTLAGSLAAVWLAAGLVEAFSGKGLVADSLVADPAYLAAVALAAAIAVLLATWWGMPVSTTHGLVGGLVGAGLASGSSVNGFVLSESYLGPLLLSPLLAIALTVVFHRLLRKTRLALGVVEESCFCVEREPEPVLVRADLSRESVVLETHRLTARLGTEVTCIRRYGGLVAGVKVSSLLDSLHYLSAGVVCFARGLNDTPKIAALLLVGTGLPGPMASAGVGLLMAVGGLLAARRVALTMSRKITPMNAGQGLTANLITGLIVVGASRLGVPVSTTHVSCGSIFGLGAVTAEARWSMVGRIVAAWVLTLPLAAAIAAGVYLFLSLIRLG